MDLVLTFKDGSLITCPKSFYILFQLSYKILIATNILDVNSGSVDIKIICEL